MVEKKEVTSTDSPAGVVLVESPPKLEHFAVEEDLTDVGVAPRHSRVHEALCDLKVKCFTSLAILSLLLIDALVRRIETGFHNSVQSVTEGSLQNTTIGQLVGLLTQTQEKYNASFIQSMLEA